MMTEEAQYKPTLMADASEATAAEPTVRQDNFDSVALYGILRNKKKAILLYGLAGMLVMVLIAFLIRPYYRATASFVPPGANPSASSALAGISQLAGAGSLLGGLKNPGDLYVGILKSKVIQSDMIKRFDLMRVYQVKKESQAENKLEDATQLMVGMKDSIVTIAVTDRSPKRAADMANVYLDELQGTTGRLALTESSQRRAFYENRLAQERDALAKAEAGLKSGQERTGLIAPSGQTASEINATAQLRAQIASREVELASLLSQETEQNPDVQRIRSELSSLRAQVDQMENGKQGPAGSLSTAQVPGLTLEYARLAREVKYHETLFDIIAKQYEAARIDEARDAPLQVLDYATVPDSKAGPPRMILALVGLLAGVLGSAAWFILSFRWKEMVACRSVAGQISLSLLQPTLTTQNSINSHKLSSDEESPLERSRVS